MNFQFCLQGLWNPCLTSIWIALVPEQFCALQCICSVFTSSVADVQRPPPLKVDELTELYSTCMRPSLIDALYE